MYEDVSGLFSHATLSSHFDKSWSLQTQMKAAVYEVEALYQMAKHYSTEEDIASEISTLTEAVRRMQVGFRAWSFGLVAYRSLYVHKVEVLWLRRWGEIWYLEEEVVININAIAEAIGRMQVG